MSGIRLETRQEKKKLDRINWTSVGKIIVSLHDHGEMKKTNIASRCRLRYDKCVSHIGWCQTLKLVKIKPDENDHDIISLTERGMELYREEFATKSFIM